MRSPQRGSVSLIIAALLLSAVSVQAQGRYMDEITKRRPAPGPARYAPNTEVLVEVDAPTRTNPRNRHWEDGRIVSQSGQSVRVRMWDGRTFTTDKENVRPFSRRAYEQGEAARRRQLDTVRAQFWADWERRCRDYPNAPGPTGQPCWKGLPAH